MREHESEFESAGLKVVVIGQGTSDELRTFLKDRDIPFEMLCDPEKNAYRAYGLARGTIWQVLLGPQVIVEGIAAYREGHKVEPIVGDPMQLPGSFVVVGGKIVHAYKGRFSSDLAPPADLLAAL